jgi:hypothetical protein
MGSTTSRRQCHASPKSSEYGEETYLGHKANALAAVADGALVKLIIIVATNSDRVKIAAAQYTVRREIKAAKPKPEQTYNVIFLSYLFLEG